MRNRASSGAVCSSCLQVLAHSPQRRIEVCPSSKIQTRMNEDRLIRPPTTFVHRRPRCWELRYIHRALYPLVIPPSHTRGEQDLRRIRVKLAMCIIALVPGGSHPYRDNYASAAAIESLAVSKIGRKVPREQGLSIALVRRPMVQISEEDEPS